MKLSMAWRGSFALLGILLVGCHGRTADVPRATGPLESTTHVVATPAATTSPGTSAPSHVPGFPALNVPFEEMRARARAAHRPAILYFCADWCGYCQKMNRETLSDSAVQRRLGAFPVAVYDPDTPTGRAVADRFGVHAFPTMVLVDETGREVDQVRGARPPAEFLAQLSRY